jgi:hypothetical protein
MKTSVLDERPATLPGRAAANLPAAMAVSLARQGHGRVVAQGSADGEWLVETDCGTLPMRRAASCLLVAEPGDRVWWCGDFAGDPWQAWIVAVLERADVPAVVELPEHTTVRGRRAVVLFDTAEFVGGCWQAVIGALRYTGTTLASVLDRVTTTARRHERYTEGSEVVQAGTLELRATQLATLHAEHVLVEGERLVKTRGAQIHMG